MIEKWKKKMIIQGWKGRKMKGNHGKVKKGKDHWKLKEKEGKFYEELVKKRNKREKN